MIAAIIKQAGSIDNIEINNLPIPDIHTNQLLIKVKCCGINPVDWKGILGGSFQTPYIPGSDIAGVVEKVGNDIKKFKAGDEVIGSLRWEKQGAFAQYIATEEKFLVTKPKNLTFEQAAGVPMASLTAWQGLFDKLDLQPGQKILIHAAAGGVGLFALQFAKLKGAFVAVTCSERNVAFLKSLGADQVIDYTKFNFSEILSDYDAVFDSIESTEESYKILKKGGKYLSITSLAKPLSAELAKKHGIIATKFLFQSDPTQLNDIVKLIEDERVKTFIDKTFSLNDAKNALLYQKQGKSRGKNILIVN